LFRINILIPSYTIRFTRSGRQRPLGIAYVEFKTRENLDAVVKQFDGAMFKKRQMSVKKHVAYDPKRRFFGIGKKPAITSDDLQLTPEQPKTKPPPQETKIEIATATVTTTALDTTSVTGTVAGTKPELSKDTLYIPKAPAKITDESLRDFFKEYGPAQIYIFRNRKLKRGAINLKSSYVSVLAKVDSSQTSLDDIIVNLKSQKLNGRHVVIKPAYKSKIEEVASKLKSPAAILGSSLVSAANNEGSNAVTKQIIDAERSLSNNALATTTA
ncbi:uncharacterized protein SPAPADRAFT_132083, partial [Spathaspora passalidarum NRRL Y-27907]